MLDLFNPLRLAAQPDVVLVWDDEDRERFFLVPLRPTLATGASGRPKFSMVRAGGEYGLLNADAELAASEAAEGAWRQALSRGHLPEPHLRPAQNRIEIVTPTPIADPRLIHPDWLEGEALLELGSPNAPVRSARMSPSLFGRNRASFAIMLDAAALAALGDGIRGRIRYRAVFGARLGGLALRISRGPSGLAVQHAFRPRPPSAPQNDIAVAVAATADLLWRLRPPGAEALEVEPGIPIRCMVNAEAELSDLLPPGMAAPGGGP